MLVFVFLSRCLFYSPLTDTGQVTIPTDEQLSAVFKKDLVMNIFRNGVFGSFRHIALHSGWWDWCSFILTTVTFQWVWSVL